MSLPPHVASCPVRRRGAAALLVLLVVLSSWGAPAGATATDGPEAEGDAAQEDDAAEEEVAAAVRVVVNGLQAVLGPPREETAPDGEQPVALPSSLAARVLVENQDDEALDGLRLVLTVHRPVTTRSGLRLALDDPRSDAGPIETVALDQPLERLPPGGVAQVNVSLPADELGLIHADDVTIHPVTISVTRGFRVLDRARFGVVGVARLIARPLEAVVLAPLDGPVSRDPEAVQQLLPGGRLDRVLRAIEQVPVDRITLAPAPHTSEDLDLLVEQAVPGATDIVTRLETVVSERGAGVVSQPYALADVPALTASSSTQDLATRAIVAGRQRLTTTLGVAPDAAHLLTSPQTETSIDLAPADVLVTTWTDTAGPDLTANPTADIPPALRTSRSAAGRGLTVLVADPWLTEQLATATGADGWSVDAQRAVVETAMLFARSPGRDGRVVAVVPPVGWEAPGRLPDELYTRLAAAPWLRLDDPVTVAGRGSVTAPWQGTTTLDPERIQLLGRVATAHDRLVGLASAVAGVETPPAVVTRTDELLRTVSVWPTEAPRERAEALLADLEQEVSAAIGTVAVPDDSVVTLASESGTIPVTVRHPDGAPLDVVVEVATQGRLSFDDGTVRLVRLETGSTETVSFAATALSRGTFPMSVVVRTPDNQVVLASTLVRVRASAVSGPALLAIAGVIVLLLVIGRLRRPRQPQLEVVR